MSFVVKAATSPGNWIHAPGSDFIFAYLLDNWSEKIKEKMSAAFLDALGMSSKIKDAVKATSGQTVVNGLYTLNQDAMTKAMNSITGMGLTASNTGHQEGDGTADAVVNAFFQSILGGLGGDVTPMNTYLVSQMGDIQTTAKGKTDKTFGTVIGLVSLMPIIEVPVTSFVYAFISGEAITWFANVNCHSVQKQKYNYNYIAATYNYNKQ
jgi:hypothetical protein